MTRRAAFALAAGRVVAAEPAVMLPVHRVVDKRAGFAAGQLEAFWSSIWPQAFADFSRCGLRLVTTDGAGEIRRSPSSRPVFVGLRRGSVNLVLTREVPLGWSRGRGVAGVTTLWDGYHVCLIALDHAHAHRVPFLGVNTCTHELLHAVMQDIYVRRPSAAEAQRREMSVDWAATRMWIGAGGADVRSSAAAYVRRLQNELL